MSMYTWNCRRAIGIAEWRTREHFILGSKLERNHLGWALSYVYFVIDARRPSLVKLAFQYKRPCQTGKKMRTNSEQGRACTRRAARLCKTQLESARPCSIEISTMP